MNLDKFKISNGKNFKISEFKTDFTGDLDSKKEAEKRLKKNKEKMRELQDKFYAHDKFSLLIIFQAMDAAGKDSTIRNVFAQCDIGGINNVAFKQPSKEESSHDFLWRCNKHVPQRGQLTIFNRSYYEEVLVVKVHPEWLGSQKVEVPVTDEFWQNRYDSINDFEKHLSLSGTKIIKFMLDVSQKEQHNRFVRRYKTPSKQWKFSIGDLKESKLWAEYQNAFDDLLKQTSTETNPWYVIPADSKPFMRLLVTEILINELSQLNPQYPPMEKIDEEDLKLIKHLMP